MDNQLAIFEQKNIRSIEHEGEMYFSIIDFIAVLTDSPSPKTYWAKLKVKLKEETGQPFPNTERLKLKADDGKHRFTDCANTEGVLRILMSVPSPKAEPFKLWLSQASQKGVLETQKSISKNNSYDALIDKIGQLWLKGRKKAANLVANVLVMTHWEIGQNIVEYEQNGNEKAEYGTKLFDKIARDLFAKHGKTFSRSSLIYIRKFYLVYPSIGESIIHQLSWTHIIELLKLDDPLERSFYEQQTVKENWTVEEYGKDVTAILTKLDFINVDSSIAVEVLETNDQYPTDEKLKSFRRTLYLINSSYHPTDTLGFKKFNVPFELFYVGPTGHYPMIENPSEFNKELEQVIRQIGKSKN